MADDTPKVVGGKLDRPYPIRTAGDVQRARVLPPPRLSAPATSAGSSPAAPAPLRRDEQPRGGFDYVLKRNKLQREISGKR